MILLRLCRMPRLEDDSARLPPLCGFALSMPFPPSCVQQPHCSLIYSDPISCWIAHLSFFERESLNHPPLLCFLRSPSCCRFSDFYFQSDLRRFFFLFVSCHSQFLSRMIDRTRNLCTRCSNRCVNRMNIIVLLARLSNLLTNLLNGWNVCRGLTERVRWSSIDDLFERYIWQFKIYKTNGRNKYVKSYLYFNFSYISTFVYVRDSV